MSTVSSLICINENPLETHDETFGAHHPRVYLDERRNIIGRLKVD